MLRAAIASHGTPQEILTDNGSQYVTWRGKSAFTRELEKRGIKQIVSAPRHPQTLGKIERFWGSLWRECIDSAVFIDLGDAQRRIGFFIDHYNFQRAHQGIDGLVPADRFFGSASEVRQTLQARVAANALELARQGTPKQPFYLTGQVGGKPSNRCNGSCASTRRPAERGGVHERAAADSRRERALRGDLSLPRLDVEPHQETSGDDSEELRQVAPARVVALVQGITEQHGDE